jgi:hypothetical protein
MKSALHLHITPLPLSWPTHMMKTLIVTLLLASVASAQTPLFDGTTFTGWEGDTEKTWRIEDGAIVAGSSGQKQPHNSYLATTKSYADFELTLQWKIDSNDGFMNGGVPFRAERLPDGAREVSGYQADLGGGYDGVLYDWVRRKKPLARPAPEVLAQAQKPVGEWNHYRIRAEGPHIRLWLNGVLTADYQEQDPDIATSGVIGLQTHGGALSVVRYKDIVITELPNAGRK